MVWFGLCRSSKAYTMEVDRREKSVEQSTNAILNSSARSENTFFLNCPVCAVVYHCPLYPEVLCFDPVLLFYFLWYTTVHYTLKYYVLTWYYCSITSGIPLSSILWNMMFWPGIAFLLPLVYHCPLYWSMMFWPGIAVLFPLVYHCPLYPEEPLRPTK